MTFSSARSGRLQAAAKQLLMWGRQYDNEKFIKRGKAILGRIEKIDKIDRPVLEPRRMDLQINGWRGSNKVLEVSDLAKVFEPAPDYLFHRAQSAHSSRRARGIGRAKWRGQVRAAQDGSRRGAA